MLALGLCNIASSFVSSMPVSGALSRGAVNHASGVATTFGGIYTGMALVSDRDEYMHKDKYITCNNTVCFRGAGTLVLLSLHFFTPYFYYIPKASLAAVIIAAVVFMVEFHVVKPIWRTKSEFATEIEGRAVSMNCSSKLTMISLWCPQSWT